MRGRKRIPECETPYGFPFSLLPVCEDEDAALRACSNGWVEELFPNGRDLRGFDANVSSGQPLRLSQDFGSFGSAPYDLKSRFLNSC